VPRPAFRLLLITDGWNESTAARVDAALSALPAGTTAVQLRCKTLTGRAMTSAALALREVTRARGALFLVNDRVDVALASGADGVHLPSNGLPPKPARRAAGEALLLGASAHSLDEARMAERAGIDYVTFGPVFPTASKAAFGPPLGLDRLSEAVRALTVPVFALGGIDLERAPACIAAGARVACIGAVLGDGVSDPAQGARALGARIGLL
jgi:thiamine-phosphate pyrophosphorylase